MRGGPGVWGPCPMRRAPAAPQMCLGGQWGAGVVVPGQRGGL